MGNLAETVHDYRDHAKTAILTGKKFFQTEKWSLGTVKAFSKGGFANACNTAAKMKILPPKAAASLTSLTIFATSIAENYLMISKNEGSQLILKENKVKKLICSFAVI